MKEKNKSHYQIFLGLYCIAVDISDVKAPPLISTA